MAEEYILKSSAHSKIFKEGLASLLDNEDVHDVTLACAKVECLTANRFILSANSPYFKKLLNASAHVAGVTLMLPNIEHQDMEVILRFMYKGDLQVPEGRYHSLRLAAEFLKVTKLLEVLPTTNIDPPMKHIEEPRPLAVLPTTDIEPPMKRIEEPRLLKVLPTKDIEPPMKRIEEPRPLAGLPTTDIDPPMKHIKEPRLLPGHPPTDIDSPMKRRRIDYKNNKDFHPIHSPLSLPSSLPGFCFPTRTMPLQGRPPLSSTLPGFCFPPLPSPIPTYSFPTATVPKQSFPPLSSTIPSYSFPTENVPKQNCPPPSSKTIPDFCFPTANVPKQDGNPPFPWMMMPHAQNPSSYIAPYNQNDYYPFRTDMPIDTNPFKTNMPVAIATNPFRTNKPVDTNPFRANIPVNTSISCSLCHKTLKNKNSYKTHKSRFHGMFQEPIVCCGKSFSTRWDIQQHKEYHHPIGRIEDTEFIINI